MMEHLSSDQITRMKEELRRTFGALSPGLTALYISLRTSEEPISDGVLTRILTDVGYVSVYKSAGYFSINLSWDLQHLQKMKLEADEERNQALDKEYDPIQ